MNMMFVYVPCATLLYLVLDLYGVIASIPALLRSVAFWLFWILFSVFNAVAYSLIQVAGAKTLAANGTSPAIAPFLILFFSTIGTFSIVQSFSLKFANYKAVDLEQMFEKFRVAVLAEAAAEKAQLAKTRKLILAKRLTAFYTKNPAAIDQDYAALMAFGGQSSAQVTADIVQAAASPRGKIAALTNIMVYVDEQGARQFLP